MNNKNSLQVLSEFTSCLNDSYFLCYGTCLGALREGSFIKHDLDIDVGIMRGDFKLEYINSIIEKGFKLIRLYGSLECGLEFSFRKNGVKVDLMVYYQIGRTIYNCLWDNGGINGLSDMIVHSYNVKLFNIQQLEICGVSFYSLGLEYIKSVYGEKWKKPITPWNWRTDHLCHDYPLKLKLKQLYG